MPEPWTTRASASIGADGIVTLVEGSAFCISSRSGEIDPTRPQGLFFRDTRFVSELRCTLNGFSPEPLAATAPDPFSGVFVLRGHPSGEEQCENCLYYLENTAEISYCWHQKLRILVGANWWCQWWEKIPE